MSGGSYDYLFLKGVSELLDDRDTLQRMADRLTSLGYANDVAEETKKIIELLTDVEINVISVQVRLLEIWRAVEWMDSGDSNEDGVKSALEKYRERIENLS